MPWRKIRYCRCSWALPSRIKPRPQLSFWTSILSQKSHTTYTRWLWTLSPETPTSLSTTSRGRLWISPWGRRTTTGVSSHIVIHSKIPTLMPIPYYNSPRMEASWRQEPTGTLLLPVLSTQVSIHCISWSFRKWQVSFSGTGWHFKNVWNGKYLALAPGCNAQNRTQIYVTDKPFLWYIVADTNTVGAGRSIHFFILHRPWQLLTKIL